MGHKLNPKVIHLGKELIRLSDYRNGRESSGMGVGGSQNALHIPTKLFTN